MTTPHPAIPAQRADAPGWPEPMFEPGVGPGEGSDPDALPPRRPPAPASPSPREAGAPRRVGMLTIELRHGAISDTDTMSRLMSLYDACGAPDVTTRDAKGWLLSLDDVHLFIELFRANARPCWRLTVSTVA